MIIFLKRIHWYWFLFWLVFFFALLYPFYYLTSRNSKTYFILNLLRQINCFCSCLFAGIVFSFEFEIPLEKNKTYIYCANHSSTLDIMAMCILAKGRFHFMGKEELLRSPILGIFFRSIDIAVHRERKISAFRAFKRAEENLENCMSLIIFPEGGIDEQYPPVLTPFKNGPFRLAIDKNIPLVAVSLKNLWQLMWDDGKKYGSRTGAGKIYVHAPIDTSALNLDDADSLKEQVYALIHNRIDYYDIK